MGSTIEFFSNKNKTILKVFQVDANIGQLFDMELHNRWNEKKFALPCNQGDILEAIGEKVSKLTINSIPVETEEEKIGIYCIITIDGDILANKDYLTISVLAEKMSMCIGYTNTEIEVAYIPDVPKSKLSRILLNDYLINIPKNRIKDESIKEVWLNGKSRKGK